MEQCFVLSTQVRSQYSCIILLIVYIDMLYLETWRDFGLSTRHDSRPRHAKIANHYFTFVRIHRTGKTYRDYIMSYL